MVVLQWPSHRFISPQSSQIIIIIVIMSINNNIIIIIALQCTVTE